MNEPEVFGTIKVPAGWMADFGVLCGRACGALSGLLDGGAIPVFYEARVRGIVAEYDRLLAEGMKFSGLGAECPQSMKGARDGNDEGDDAAHPIVRG